MATMQTMSSTRKVVILRSTADACRLFLNHIIRESNDGSFAALAQVHLEALDRAIVEAEILGPGKFTFEPDVE